ncbi:hypothetical protein [Roseobacter litoralis]|uniref:Uncharacterized protein n=1 Tax=Roseobacter litoralis (strain ATCC 49566 / DSM 6996 / JCM 21268 / NBRC 15278 / OCh 149) TaxID=391595 RepID=F7ZB04_ROSLO|nr:hypothetical protein [Roseobacter litoralis]AEI95546.1 hypothetical protein RLO149_c036070 [Roseobacter litoralis Och 149]
MDNKDAPFFVGYLPTPKGLRALLLGICVLFISGLAGLGFALGTAQDDPGPGAFRFDYGRQTVTGVMEMTPYPLLRVTQGNDRILPGDTLMLSAGGKTGVQGRAAPLEGQLVQVSGVILERGDLNMMQVRGGRQGISAVEGEPPAQSVEPLGRWKLAGEICDGKCLAGAMRPGIGLAHKACANLCLLGGVPPVFVSSQPVDGEEFLLITGPDGTELPQEAYDYIARYVSLEGEIERRGDLLVLMLDPETLTVLK